MPGPRLQRGLQCRACRIASTGSSWTATRDNCCATAASFTCRQRPSISWSSCWPDGRAQFRRRKCWNTSGRRRLSRRPTWRASWPRFVERSATQPPRLCFCGRSTGSGTGSSARWWSAARRSRRSAAGPRPYLVFEQRHTMLLEGSNVIGRAPDAAIQCDVTGVSRHHARIVLANGAATLEDLDSKNGTHLNSTRVTSAPLSDGDEIRLGRRRSCSAWAPHPMRRKRWGPGK